MSLSAEGKIATALALLGLGGAGALFVLPHPYADIVGWLLIAIAVIGLILLGGYHFKIKPHRGGIILTTAVFTLCLIASFGVWRFWPNRLFKVNDNNPRVDFEVRNVTYPNGITVAGQPWGHNLIDTRIHIRNASDHAYENIDFFVQTDLVVVTIGQEPSMSRCYFSAPRPRSMPNIILGKDAFMLFEAPPNMQPISSIYRGQCDKLPARSEIEVVLGVSSFKFGESNPLGNSRANPAWIAVELNYEANGSLQTETFKKCFVNNCQGLDDFKIKHP
jgi:hypothetical protein